MILPPTTIHITQQHIPNPLMVLVNDAVNTYNKNGLVRASETEQVGVITGYETIQTIKECGGFCDYNNSVIAFNGKPSFSIIFHEIAHAMQAKCGILSKCDNIISDWLNIEWQAETISFIMAKSLINKKAMHEHFKSYFSPDHVMFLKNWYGNYIEFDDKNIKIK